MGEHCGPCNKWYTKLIPDLIFSDACKKHDQDYDKIIKDAKDYIQYMYEIKGYKEDILSTMTDDLIYKRKQADLAFHMNMISIVNVNNYCYIKKRIYIKLADIYYQTVRDKGWDSIYIPLYAYNANLSYERDKRYNLQIKRPVI